MPGMRLSISCLNSSVEESTPQMNKFPECEDCMNKSFDPFQCEDCEDACNFEPYEDEEDSGSDAEDMTIEEFKDFWRHAA